MGMTAAPEDDPFSTGPDLTFAIGLTAHLHRTGDNHLIYGEGTALFLPGVFGARGGVVFGKGFSSNYSEITDTSSSTQYDWATAQYVTTTTFTSKVYDKKIHNIMGLDLSGALVSYDGTPSTVVAGGFGWYGQHVVEVQGQYDATNEAGGFRFNLFYSIGAQSFTVPLHLGADIYFDSAHPVPLTLLIGIGGGSGFQW